VALRLGLRTIRGLARNDADAIMRARRPFASFTDLVKQTGLGSGSLRKLARADAFRSLHLDRRGALWQALPQGERLPLFDHLETDEPSPPLPPMAPFQEVLADYKWMGMTLRQHPMSFMRGFLDRLKVVTAGQLPKLDSNVWLKVAGVVLMRQRPSTAKGITFVTLEDETGMVNMIVRQEIWERYRRVARTATVMLAHGRLERQGEVIHVLVSKLEDLTDRLKELSVTSRDFR
jgi:error-prone DNA polymerase